MTVTNQMLRQQLRGLHIVRTHGIYVVQITGSRGENHRNALFFRHQAQVIAAARRPGDHHAVNALIQEHGKTLRQLFTILTTMQQKRHPALCFQCFR